MNAYETAIYEYLRELANHGKATPRIRDISDALGTSPRTVRRYIKTLCDDGHIKMTIKQGYAYESFTIGKYSTCPVDRKRGPQAQGDYGTSPIAFLPVNKRMREEAKIYEPFGGERAYRVN